MVSVELQRAWCRCTYCHKEFWGTIVEQRPKIREIMCPECSTKHFDPKDPASLKKEEDYDVAVKVEIDPDVEL